MYRAGVALDVSEDVLGDVLAEGAIALELRFAKELVSCGLVGELRVINNIVADIGRLITGERGFDIEESPRVRLGVDVVVMNPAYRTVPTGMTRAFFFRKRADVDLDMDAEVLSALANQTPKVPERQRGVGSGVAQHDVAAAAADQLVDAQVLEVASIR